MSLGLSDNNDDAALIDSYFLPGGILDPDEDEGEDQPLTARISPSWPVVMSRVPSNPWSNDDGIPNTTSTGNQNGNENPSLAHEVQGLAAKETNRLNSSHHIVEIAGNPLHLKPPPGYQHYQETYFNAPITKPSESHLHNTYYSHSQSDSQHHPAAEFQRSRLNPSSPGPIDLPLLALQDRTIRRPCPHLVENSLSLSHPLHHNASSNHIGESVQEGIGGHEPLHRDFHGLGASRNYSHRQSCEPMHVIDQDSSHNTIQSGDDGSVGAFLKAASSERATTIEGSDLQMDEEDVEDHDDEEEDDDDDEEEEDKDDGEADDIEESSDEEIPFPIDEFAFLHSSKDPDTTMSSLSTSSSSSMDAQDSHLALDDNDYGRCTLDEDNLDASKPPADPDSAVAVILDFSDTGGGHGTVGHHNNISNECGHNHDRLSSDMEDMEKASEVRNDRVQAETPQIAVPCDAWPAARSAAESIHSSQSSSKPDHLQETTTSIFSRVKVWSNNFQEYVAWMDDLNQTCAMVFSTTWAVLGLFTSWGTKLLLIASLLLFQGWKYAFVQLIEEPHVTISYAIFYFMPSFCSLLRGFFLMPHWTPQFITSLAVWSLCTQISAGPLTFDNHTIPGYLRHIINSYDFSSPEARSRDERACLTILRILRFVLPFFFFADGFSSEFGTIMGVSGSSRLTTAFMMSLVRKSLVSSPIGWISWAIQVLLATHHHSTPLVDGFVLMSGLASIRLIRYLDALRASNKRRQGKEH